MWSWMGERGDGVLTGHALLILIGLGAVMAGIFFVQQGTAQSQWPAATAQIVSLDVKCRMTTGTGRRRYGGSRTVVIACDQVDQFRADNADGMWRLSRTYTSELRVSRDGAAVEVPMSLPSTGPTPEVGDSFTVLQNPSAPTEIVFADADLSAMMTGLFVDGLGVFMLLAAFFWL